MHRWPHVGTRSMGMELTVSFASGVQTGLRRCLLVQIPPVETSRGEERGLAGKFLPGSLCVLSSVSCSLTSQLGHREVCITEGRWERAIFSFLFLLECQCQQQSSFAFLKLCFYLQVQLSPISISQPLNFFTFRYRHICIFFFFSALSLLHGCLPYCCSLFCLLDFILSARLSPLLSLPSPLPCTLMPSWILKTQCRLARWGQGSVLLWLCVVVFVPPPPPAAPALP